MVWESFSTMRTGRCCIAARREEVYREVVKSSRELNEEIKRRKADCRKAGYHLRPERYVAPGARRLCDHCISFLDEEQVNKAYRAFDPVI